MPFTFQEISFTPVLPSPNRHPTSWSNRVLPPLPAPWPRIFDLQQQSVSTTSWVSHENFLERLPAPHPNAC
mgnify:CR=1 FL=1